MALVAAMILDAIFGEPDALWRRAPHPAVLMGRAVAWLERHLNRGAARRARGVLTLLILVALAGGLGGAIAALPLQPLPEILLAAILLAQKSLVDHVQAVARALDQGLEAGRIEVAKIVGRDVRALDQPGVARAAIESGAENFSDGVIAPALWFLLLGAPGILIYKVVNTADSMIGHRTERYHDFGWASARLDDLLNLVPSRLSALLFSLVSGSSGPWRAAVRDAPQHRSPNAGWPEAAMAEAIGIALSGPRIYDGEKTDDPFVNPGGAHDIGPADIERAVDMLWRGWAAMLVLALIIGLISIID